MAGPSPDHEGYRLLSGWCDGSLEDAGLERLDALLRSDPEFRDFYLKSMDQRAGIEREPGYGKGPLGRRATGDHLGG